MSSMKKSNSSNNLYKILAVFSIFTLIYLLTLSRHFSFDSLIYASSTESQALIPTIDMYHILVSPINILFYKIWLSFGWSQGAILPLQILNALGSAAFITLFYITLSNIFDNISTVEYSELNTILYATVFALGLSGSIWLLSTEAEFVLPPLVPALIIISILINALIKRKLTLSIVITLGVMTTLVIFFYLTNIFLIPIVIIGIYLDSHLKTNKRQRLILVYLITSLSLTILIFSLLFIFLMTNHPNALKYFLGGGLYGIVSLENIPRGIYAFLRSIALYPNLGMNDRTSQFLSSASIYQILVFGIYYCFIFIFAITPPIFLYFNRIKLSGTIRNIILLLLSWAGLTALFAFYWVPSDFSFWVIPITVWFILLGLSLSVWYIHVKNKMKIFVIFFSISIPITLALLNALFIILPHHFYL